ncbi:MAG: WXG100 family type VII secretion target [Ectobacillus sp.]
MGKIIVSQDHLAGITKDLQQVVSQIREMDSRLQQTLNSLPWESRSRGEVTEIFASYQAKMKMMNKQLEELSRFVDKTRQEFAAQDEKELVFLGMTGFNAKAPIDGAGNTFGTVTGALAVAGVAYRVRNGYMVKRELNKRTPRVLVRDSYAAGDANRRLKGRDYKIHYLRDIEKQIANGTASGKIKEIAAMVKPGYAVKTALKDKLGWASVAIDAYTDTKDNLKENASGDKIAGDIIGNVVVGGATTAAAAAITVAALPAAVPALGVAAVGFGVSVGLTYVAEGIKWNIDTDGDGEDDSIKDMVKTGAKQVCSTVAGWFK